MADTRKATSDALLLAAFALRTELRANGTAEGYFYQEDADDAQQRELKRAVRRLADQLERRGKKLSQ